MNKYVLILLKEMCRMVNANYDKIDFKKPEWYYLYTWNQEQEDKFKEFIVDLLKNNREMRREFNLRTLKMYKQFANHFVFNYGWKLEG